jgi:uncharacterized protein (TIGR02186 family)
MRVLFILLLLLGGARAEKLITTLSHHRVFITSNFTGTDVVLFGAIEREGISLARGTGYEIAVIVKGQEASFIVRQKARTFGLWLNAENLILPPTPTAYMTLTTKKINDILSQDFQQEYNVGAHTLLKNLGQDPFRLAFLRQQELKGLYKTLESGVSFLTPALFRARIPIPAHTPTGIFSVATLLISDGVIISRAETNFEVVKRGSEAFISRQAHENAALYGLLVLSLALFCGYMAHLIFRKD